MDGIETLGTRMRGLVRRIPPIARSSFVLSTLLLLAAPGSIAAQDGAISGADTAWMLVATAMVLLMTPALAFFYGGLVRSRDVLNTMMMSFISLGLAGVLWAVVGYSLAFSSNGGFIGDLSMALLNGVGLEANGTIPHLLFMAFQGTFAIITAALISGAVVGRMNFGAYMAYIGLWVLVVYAPVAHWVWGGGWLGELGALDFAGGTVVHVNAGAAALVAAVVVGSRSEHGRMAFLPHNVPFVLLGSALLWFGWFGFNGGSALAADGIAALAFVNTMLAPAATLLVWALLDFLSSRHITAVGAATAIVVGLVAVTPAAGFVSPVSALLLGGIAAVPCHLLLHWRAGTRLDDSLDVFAAHGVGGITGAILTGVFADAALGGADGLLYGNPGQLWIQTVAVVAVFAYSGVATFVLLKAISFVTSLRPDEALERRGLDLVCHGEEAYATGDGALLIHEDDSPERKTIPDGALTPAPADPT